MFHHEGNDLRVTRNNLLRIPAPLSPTRCSGYSLPYPYLLLSAIPTPCRYAASACIPSSTTRVTRNTRLRTRTIDILGTLSSKVAPPLPPTSVSGPHAEGHHSPCHTEDRPRDLGPLLRTRSGHLGYVHKKEVFPLEYPHSEHLSSRASLHGRRPTISLKDLYRIK